MHELSDADLEAGMEAMVGAGGPGFVLPADISQEVLARYRDQCAEKKDWAKYVACMLPWREGEGQEFIGYAADDTQVPDCKFSWKKPLHV